MFGARVLCITVITPFSHTHEFWFIFIAARLNKPPSFPGKFITSGLHLIALSVMGNQQQSKFNIRFTVLV